MKDNISLKKKISNAKGLRNLEQTKMNTPRSKLRGIFPKRCYFCC